MHGKLVLAFDTSNEFVSIGVGKLDVKTSVIEVIATSEQHSNRQSNVMLLPEIDEIFKRNNLKPSDIDLVAVGVGPGSFTGVRIAMACAKGLAVALNLPLIGISTLDVIAQNVALEGVFGKLYVMQDAMRKEVYPATFNISNGEITRLSNEHVEKATSFIASLSSERDAFISGDGLCKYGSEIPETIAICDEITWNPTGKSLLKLVEREYAKNGEIIFDKDINSPQILLPVYTRLSDAEEAEREKLRLAGAKNLITGVQGDYGILPACAEDSFSIATLEKDNFTSDAWSEKQIAEDILLGNRIWYKAQDNEGYILGYVDFMLTDDAAELLKICVVEDSRNKGIAQSLLLHALLDIRDLKKDEVYLEVRSDNVEALCLYKSIGFEEYNRRSNYYNASIDAILMKAHTAYAILKCKEKVYANYEVESSITTSKIDKAGLSDAKIMSFESSCDETAASVVTESGCILSSIIASSASFHARFGGVVPEIASRKHLEVIASVAISALESAGLKNFSELSAIAVTSRPGLVGSLVVGVSFAKAIAWALSLPLIDVDHLEGHFFANKLASEKIEFPSVASLISGGNTILIGARNYHDYEVLGGSIDDAVGEAFDKLAKALNLPYPGGPEISRLAVSGNPKNVDLPRPMLHSHDLRMSLSGLKTACILKIEEMKSDNTKAGLGEELTKQQICDLCAAFEASVCEVQVKKAKLACEKFSARSFCFGGGVAANKQLRDAYSKMCDELHIPLVLSPLELCGDNAAMIGLAAIDKYKQGQFASLELDVSSKSEIFANNV